MSDIYFGEIYMLVVDSQGNYFSIYDDGHISIRGEFLAYDWCAIFELSKETRG